MHARSLLRRAVGATLSLLGLATVLGVVGWAAFAPLTVEPQVATYVIPRGTADRSAVGPSPPAALQLTLGVHQALVVRNDDTVPQQFGPALLAPGQSYRLPIRHPGAFQFSCSFHGPTGFLLQVGTGPAPGWERLRWRLARWGGRLLPGFCADAQKPNWNGSNPVD